MRKASSASDGSAVAGSGGDAPQLRDFSPWAEPHRLSAVAAALLAPAGALLSGSGDGLQRLVAALEMRRGEDAVWGAGHPSLRGGEPALRNVWRVCGEAADRRGVVRERQRGLAQM
jgi:hypothetical protein